MKLIVLFLTIFYGLAFAESICLNPNNNLQEIENCLKLGVEISGHELNEDSVEATLASASLFLDQYKERVDFKVNTAEMIISRLKRFIESDAVSKEEKSRLCLLQSGLHGRISDKLRSNGGVEHGKLALQSIKKALGFNRDNSAAATAYATTIARFTEKNVIVRGFIGRGLDIKIGDEAKAAMKALEQVNMQNHPLYKKLEDF